jgi:hypothetical protein
LPAREQRVLDLVEGDLRGCAPRLASMFSIFARLTAGDGDPRKEPLPPPPRRRLSRLAAEVWLAVFLALGMAGLVAFLAVSSAGVHPCTPVAGTPYPVLAASPALSCQAAQKPQGAPRQ